jgi:predicted Zn-dependent protease
LRFDSVLVPAGQPIGKHLSNDLMEGVEISGLEDVDVNGFPAAIAIAKGRDWNFRLAGIRFGSSVYRIVYATRNLTPEADARFRSSILSFRRLSGSEATEVRPQRIAVVKVKAGDTLTSLSGRMDVPNRPLERFQVLNGLDPEQTLNANDRVKLIVE